MTMRRAASALGWCVLVLALLRGVVSPVEACSGSGSQGWVAAATPRIPSFAELLPPRIKVWPWQPPCPEASGRVLVGPTVLHTATLVGIGVGLIVWPSPGMLAAVLGVSLIAAGVLRAIAFPAQYCQAGLVRYVKVWPWQEVRLPRVCASAMSSDIALTLFHSAILASIGAGLLLLRKSHRATLEMGGEGPIAGGPEKMALNPREMSPEETRLADVGARYLFGAPVSGLTPALKRTFSPASRRAALIEIGRLIEEAAGKGDMVRGGSDKTSRAMTGEKVRVVADAQEDSTVRL